MEKVDIFVISCNVQAMEPVEKLSLQMTSSSEPLPRLGPVGPGKSPVFASYKSKVWFLNTDNGSADSAHSESFSFNSMWSNVKKGGKPLTTFGVISHGFKKIYSSLNHPGKTIVNIHVWKWQNERENRELSESLVPFIQVFCAKVIFYSEDCQVYLTPPDVPSSVVILPVETYDPQNPTWRGQVALYSESGKAYEFVKYLELGLWNDDVLSNKECKDLDDLEPLFFGDKLEVINQCEFRTIPESLFSGLIYNLSASCDIRSRHAEDARDFFTLANAEPSRSFVFRLIYSLDSPLSSRESSQSLRSIGRITRHVSFASFPLVENGNRRLLLFGLRNMEETEVEQEVEKKCVPERDLKDYEINPDSIKNLRNIPLEVLLRLVQLRKNIDPTHSSLFFDVLKSRASDFHTKTEDGDDGAKKEQRASWPSCETLEKRNRQMGQLYSVSSQGDSRVYAISTAEAVRIFKEPTSPPKVKSSPRKTPVKKPTSDTSYRNLKFPELYSKRIVTFGISYNYGRESEQKEAEGWRLQEKLEAQETESSCNPLDAGFRCFVLRRKKDAVVAENPDVIAKQRVNPKPENDKRSLAKKTASPQVLRRSPRKRRLSGDEEAQQPPRKRAADSVKDSTKESRTDKNSQLKEDFTRVIYKCLKPRGIATKDPLYLQCGNQLYAVLKNFVREQKDGDTSAQKLLEMCDKSVDAILEQCRNQKRK